MRSNQTRLLTAALVPVMMTGAATPAPIAATDFDGRTLGTVNVANDTATNLNWTTNGIEDPGGMTVLREGTTPQALFDGTELTRNLFAPALNAGNLNTFWTTTVDLTVAAGSTVTVTDVTFDYWPVSASQVLNVPRRSDFIVRLLDPSAAELGSVTIVDALGGTTATPQVPTLVAAFAVPVVLAGPGTYTIEIQGGDIPGVGVNETGNHTAIDNLSINGEVGAPDSPRLVIAPNAANPGSYDFRWPGKEGKVYDLVSATDLSTAPAGWPVWQGHADIAGTVPENTLANVPGGGGAARFFAVVEKDPPP